MDPCKTGIESQIPSCSMPRDAPRAGHLLQLDYLARLEPLSRQDDASAQLALERQVRFQVLHWALTFSSLQNRQHIKPE